MNVINYKRVRDELKKSFSMDRDGSAIVLDLTSGELVAFSGAVSYSKAADRAGSFYVIWNAQDQSASQHDTKLEKLMICNPLKNDFLVSIPNPKARTTEEGFLLVVTADPSIEYGALKRMAEQSALDLRSLLYDFKKTK